MSSMMRLDLRLRLPLPLHEGSLILMPCDSYTATPLRAPSVILMCKVHKPRQHLRQRSEEASRKLSSAHIPFRHHASGRPWQDSRAGSYGVADMTRHAQQGTGEQRRREE